MAIVTPGQPGAIDNIDISQNTFRTQAGEVTSAVLRLAGGEVDSTSTTTLYVNHEIGSDKFVAGIADNTVTPPLSNQQLTCGYSESAPFKTLNRGLIEAARLSVQSGVGNDLYDRVLIKVAASEYVVDNTPSTGLTVSQWPNDYEPTEEDLRAFNSEDMGIILPRGVSIIGADLRKSVIRPRSVPSAGGNPVTDRGSLFKTTGGSFFFNFTFKDSLTYQSSHHLLQAFSFCSQSDLTAYYQKIATAFNLSSSDVEVINPGETQITTEYPDNQVSAATDSVKGSSGYVFNCSLRSDYGMCGMYLDGSDGVSGLRPLPPPRCLAQCLLRAAPRAGQQPRRLVAGAAGLERTGASLSVRTLRRPAPARGHGPRHRATASGFFVRRTSVQPRCQAARPDSARDSKAAPRVGYHQPFCDARSGRSHDLSPTYDRDERRSHGAIRYARRGL